MNILEIYLFFFGFFFLVNFCVKDPTHIAIPSKGYTLDKDHPNESFKINSSQMMLTYNVKA